MNGIEVQLSNGVRAFIRIDQIQAVVERDAGSCEIWVKECPEAIRLTDSYLAVTSQVFKEFKNK